MGHRWAITPAALGVAAAVGLVGVTGASASTLGPVPTSIEMDWEGWGWQPGGSTGGWTPYGSGTDTATTSSGTLSSTAAGAVADVTPSVVNIDTVMDYGSAEAAGTGIVIGSDGIVLTNHHVVEGATAITGTVVGTGETYPAIVLGYDPDTDVAVIDLTGASDLPVATLGDSDEVRVGDLVVGVGNAGGVGGDPTSVEGQVTALGQTITATDANGANAETLDNVIGTNADIQAGQSGGPLVNADGDVVGVDVAASAGYSGSSTSGYAIPIEDATAVVQQILAGTESGTVHVGATPFLGVELATQSTTGAGTPWGYPGGRGYRDSLGSSSDPGTVGGTSGTTGVPIAGVVPGSAAEQVGLAAGDSITTMNGAAVSTTEQLSASISSVDVGAQLSITWTDASGSAHSATVTLGAGPVG